MGIAVTSGVNANIIGQLIANVKAFFEILKRFLNVLKEAFLCSKNPAVSQDTAGSSLSKNPKLAAVARKQRYAGLRGKCCGTRVRGSAPITPAGTVGKRVPSGHNRCKRLATRRCDTKRAGNTAVVPATIEWQQCLLHLHFFGTLPGGIARYRRAIKRSYSFCSMVLSTCRYRLKQMATETSSAMGKLHHTASTLPVLLRSHAAGSSTIS